jgi:transposase-like protein
MALLQLELGEEWVEENPQCPLPRWPTAKQMYADSRPVKEIAEVLGVSRPTIYRALESVA